MGYGGTGHTQLFLLRHGLCLRGQVLPAVEVGRTDNARGMDSIGHAGNQTTSTSSTADRKADSGLVAAEETALEP